MFSPRGGCYFSFDLSICVTRLLVSQALFSPGSPLCPVLHITSLYKFNSKRYALPLSLSSHSNILKQRFFVQIEAIRSGLNPGLTLVVGPPGTGKTDVAVQIISNLYHNYPNQRILMVAHSNQALNDLFEKIMERDIAEHHLLRLGKCAMFVWACAVRILEHGYKGRIDWFTWDSWSEGTSAGSSFTSACVIL